MINRRTFLQTTVAVSLLTPTVLFAANPPNHLDLWEAQIETIMQMATDYQFSDEETKGLFGYPAWNQWSRAELRLQMLEPFARGSRDMQDRVENILTVHTWLRAKYGSCVQAQLYELNMPRVDFYAPTKIVDGTLGSLLQNGGYFQIRQAAQWCRARSGPQST